MKHSIIATIVLFIILIGAFIYGGRLTSVTNDLKEKAMLEEIRKQEEKEAQALAFRQRLKAKAMQLPLLVCVHMGWGRAITEAPILILSLAM